MATAKPSTHVAVVSLGGHWQYGDFVKKGALTYMAKREAKEAIAAKVVRLKRKSKKRAHLLKARQTRARLTRERLPQVRATKALSNDRRRRLAIVLRPG